MRPARLDDLDQIVALRLALLREYREHPLYIRSARRRARSRARRSVLHAADRARRDHFARRTRSGSVVGTLALRRRTGSPLLLPERYCYVSSVYVAPGGAAARRASRALRRGRALVRRARRSTRCGCTTRRRRTPRPPCGARSASRSSKRSVAACFRRDAAVAPGIADARRALADAGHHDLAHVRLGRLRGRRARRDCARVDAVRQRDGRRDRRAFGTHARRGDAQDERVPSMVERLASALSLGSPEMMPPVPAGSDRDDRRAHRRRDAARDRRSVAGRARRSSSAAARSVCSPSAPTRCTCSATRRARRCGGT